MSNFKIYLKSILTTLILGLLISFILSGYIGYNSLEKVVFSPPENFFQ